jgi:hypothetical protein
MHTTLRNRSFLLLMLAVAPAAHAVMYRWVDQNGSVTYSNQLPPDGSRVRGLTVVDDPAPPTAYERRAMEIINGERGKWPGENTATLRESQPLPGASYSRDPGGQEPWNRDAEAFPAFGGTEAPPPRASVRGLPEAVQDPCLRSSDPKCHERNRNAYVPYLGYSPSAARAARASDLPVAIGASSPTAAGGAVGGSFPAVAPATPTPRRVHTWHPRDSLKDAKDLK